MRKDSYKSEFKEDFHFQDKRFLELDKRIVESKNDMYKAMFVSGLVQFIAIMAGILAIVSFIMNK